MKHAQLKRPDPCPALTDIKSVPQAERTVRVSSLFGQADGRHRAVAAAVFVRSGERTFIVHQDETVPAGSVILRGADGHIFGIPVVAGGSGCQTPASCGTEPGFQDSEDPEECPDGGNHEYSSGTQKVTYNALPAVPDGIHFEDDDGTLGTTYDFLTKTYTCLRCGRRIREVYRLELSEFADDPPPVDQECPDAHSGDRR